MIIAGQTPSNLPLPVPVNGGPPIYVISVNGRSGVVSLTASDVTNALGYTPAVAGGVVSSVDWAGIVNKPLTFAPTPHTHEIGEVNGLQDALNGLAVVTWAEVTDKPSTFPPTAHVHTWSEINDKPTTFPPETHTHTWASITSKPTTFPPSAHTHLWADITDKPATFTPAAHTHGWTEITGKPSTFAPSPHTHVINDVTGLQTALDEAASTANISVVNISAVATGGAQSITLPSEVAADQVLLSLNGLEQMYGADYTISGTTLTLLSGVQGDRVLIRYFATSVPEPVPTDPNTGQPLPPPPDTTAPQVSAVSGTATGSTTATISGTTDEGNGTVYAIVSTEFTMPTDTQVIAGNNHANVAAPKATYAVTSIGSFSFPMSGLSSSTFYYVYMVHVDAAGNKSPVVRSSTNFGTPAGTGTGTGGTGGDGGTNTSTVLWNNSVGSHPYAQDFWTDADPTAFTSIVLANPTQAVKEMMTPDIYDPATGRWQGQSNRNVSCWIFNANYSDRAAMPIWVEASHSQTEATRLANICARSMGRMPNIMRVNMARMMVPRLTATNERDMARAESLGHFFCVSPGRIDQRVAEGKFDNTVFHECTHAALQQQSEDLLGEEFLGPWKTPIQAWKDAMALDGGNFITEYGRSSYVNQGNYQEDFAETGVFAYILKYKPDRIPVADRTIIQNHTPGRIAYFQNTVFTVA